MSSNYIDIGILLILALFALIGFKRGFFKQTIIFVGGIIILIVAYKLKNIVGDFLVLNVPFMSFNNFLRGSTVINIVFYQTIAFLVVYTLLTLLFKIVVSLTGVFEKLLKATIILGIPSKILGFVVGLIEGYLILYVSLFFLSQPAFNFKTINDNKYVNKILNNTPIVSKYAKSSLDLMNDIYAIKDITTKDEMDYKLLDLVLDKKVVDIDVVKQLKKEKKINFKNIDEVIAKYEVIE